PIKIFLHQVSEHESEDHRRTRITVAPHEIAEQTEGDDHDKIDRIAIDTEGAHQNENEHDGNHEAVADLGQLGELRGQSETDQRADDSRNALKPDDAVNNFRVFLHHFRTR